MIKSKKSTFDVKKLCVLAVLSALAFGATLVTNLIPPVMFLSYDAKDAIILIASLIYGPLSGLLMSVVVSFVEMLTISTTSYIGFIMNVLSTATYVCTVSLIYHKKRDFKGILIGMATGIILSTAVMLLWNYLITPIYMSVPREAVVELMLPLFLPFNLIKYGLNSALAMLLYKRVINILRKTKLIEQSDSTQSKSSTTIVVTLASLCAVITFIFLFLVLQGSL